MSPTLFGHYTYNEVQAFGRVGEEAGILTLRAPEVIPM